MQVARRVAFAIKRPSQECRGRLPWGSSIAYDPNETVGTAIGRRGVFDLLVCETLVRLADSGETSLDVGANIGQMTSALADAVGPTGLVIAFEPHPVVFDRLVQNVRVWTDRPATSRISLRHVAVSDREGTATLVSGYFDVNQGSASLEQPDQTKTAVNTHVVPIQRLDSVVGAATMVGVMKIDIEGHELMALKGAAAMLSAGCIRDIVFEEQRDPPTAVTQLLEEQGYTILRLSERLLGPSVCTLDQHIYGRVGRGDDRNLLATRAPERAIRRLAVRGWAIYGAGPARRFRRRIPTQS